MSPDTNPYAPPAAVPARKRPARRLDAQTKDFYRRYRNALGAVALAVGGVIGTSRIATSDTAKAVAAIIGMGGMFAGAKLSDKRD
jgi:hypothetical protein